MASFTGSNTLTCYTVGLNFVTSSNQYFPCPATDGSGHSSCCYSGDYCMEDGLCHYTHEVEGGTGYYMAGCTDETWQDDSCPKACTSEYGADVTYSMASDTWNCCVSTEDSLDCQNPSNFTVSAPAPESLSTVTRVNTNVPSSAVLTPIGSITSISTSESGSASASSGSANVTFSGNASGSTTAANMTMLFSGSPTRNSSTAASTTSERSRTSQRSTVTSVDVTQQTETAAEASQTSAAASASSSGNAASHTGKSTSKGAVLCMLAALSSLFFA